MTMYRLPIRYRNSGDKGHIDVKTDNYVTAIIIFDRIMDNSDSFVQDGKILYWKDYKLKRGGRWVKAQ